MPFVLKLPMARNKLQDFDEETAFDFAAGIDELRDIIRLSDYSCHHAPDTSIKGGKTEWWAGREALDHRMHELLINMENIWLGGFRGILSQHRRQPDLLGRFRKSMENILDRHLPSRQGSKSKATKITLDSNVLELFIGLGDDKDGTIDMDEQVLDLLYFVVDVLQFGGERNAYDELDFDSMSIEALDAMRAYHEASTTIETGDKHLILVLDKRLHSFPWESLPCLQQQSVSRVGSMLHLRERVLALRRQQATRASPPLMADAYTISSESGTYILNPSGDLTGTQATLEPLLRSLASSEPTSWSSRARRTPSEVDFTTALSTKNMLLYFGHGSGNQYVRNRSVKKLDTCSPVVWLMGCSSGVVTEHGDFQAESVPLSYLVAGHTPHPTTTNPFPTTDDDNNNNSSSGGGGGASTDNNEENSKYHGRQGLCMSIIATLWDVTDKDIDRFSVRVGEEWGLWSSSSTSSTLSSSATTTVNAGGISDAPKTPGKRARSVPKTPRKTPGRSRSRAAGDDRESREGQGAQKKRSLVGAVVKGREACYLRYLNGAAAVVYGVPVYLGD